MIIDIIIIFLACSSNDKKRMKAFVFFLISDNFLQGGFVTYINNI